MDKRNKELEESWHDNPENWKLGVVYYNKNDNRVFTDKHNPNYGTTLNFANPKTYLFLLFSTLFFGFVIYMTTNNK